MILLKNKYFIRGLTAIMTAAMVGGLIPAGSITAIAGVKSESVRYSSNIGSGVNYTSKFVITDGNKKQLMHILTADLSNPGANVIFSKAKDIEKKQEVLSKQVQREIFKGNNVVGGINADMFSMGIGFSTGPQVVNGAILTGHNAKSEEKIYPVFYTDTNKQAHIENISLTGKLDVLNSDGSTAAETALDNINRDNCQDKMVVVNKQLNETGAYDFSQYLPAGAVAVVKGINEPIMLDKKYTGTVEAIYTDRKSIEIPEDGVLIAAGGYKGKWLKAYLKQGGQVSFSFTYDKPIVNAIGTYTYLIKNGRLIGNSEMISDGANPAMVSARKARSALGITADNKVLAITVDGGKPSNGKSDGITYYELGQTLLNLGAVQAVALDGGGSSQMNVKLFGKQSVSVVNTPSDGRERALTNGIIFTSSRERTYVVGKVFLDKTINIYKNTNYQFQANGMDTNYNFLDLSNSSLKWNVSGGIGSIDSKGNFHSVNRKGAGTVTLTAAGKSAACTVNVTDNIKSLGFTDTGIMQFQDGERYKFGLTAVNDKGQSVVVGNENAAWSLSGNFGTVSKDGIFTVNSSSGKGIVYAKLAGKTATIHVEVIPKVVLIDGFEHNDNKRYTVDGYVGGTGSVTSSIAKSGRYAYRITYDYDKNWTRQYNGTINLNPTFADKNGNDITDVYTSSIKPKKIGMWVYGNGNAPWLRAILEDGDNEEKTIELASRIDWTGWKYIEADIPKEMPEPITLDRIYMVETDKNLHLNGTVYIDDISYIYTDDDDKVPPEVSSFKPAGATVYNRNTNISFTLKDNKTGVNENSIKAYFDGSAVKVDYNPETGAVNYKPGTLSEGPHTFTLTATDKSGNVMNPTFIRKFNVSLKADTAAPVISKLYPRDGATVKTQTPRISVNIKDDQTGVDAKDISILIDGAKQNVYYDESSGYAYAMPSALSAGAHAIIVTAKDRSGNSAAGMNTTFLEDPIKQPSNADKFTFDILSDTHATVYGRLLFKKAAADDSELVIHNGDIVDTDVATEWNEALNQIKTLNGKSFMITPGNHEAFTGSLDNFYKYFGEAIYSFDYGNSLFVSLNSALGGGISATDPTQFDYLQRLLASNKKNNIFVFTHVPTRDSLGTSHQMNKKDADKLEKILSDYKKLNPSKNVNVISGDEHYCDSYTVGGVVYTVDGNGSTKTYVRHEYGSYLSYAKFFVNGNSVSRKFEPMSQNISIVNNAIDNKVLKMVKGTKIKLNLYGDFTAYSADYITPLNNVKYVDAGWTSDNPAAVSVDSEGNLSANWTGTANITASVNGKSYTLKVVSTSQTGSVYSGIKILTSVDTLIPGSTARFQIEGWDIYGNAVLLEDAGIKWTLNGNSTKIDNGFYLVDEPGNKAVITAEYLGLKDSITLDVIHKTGVKKSSKK